jgi:hypothetical protein
MGTWGTGAFDNDTAADWLYALEEVDDLSLIETTIASVLDGDDEYLDADVAAEALAACEVVARLLGRRGVRHASTETLDKWVEKHSLSPSKELLESARKAIGRVLSGDSELRELWSESEGTDWLAVVEDLRLRLS